MEDDKLDFGDLDDFDAQQDELLDETGEFSNNIEDLAALEKELGIDDLDSINTQQPASTSEPPSSSSTDPKKSTSLSSTKPVTIPSSTKNNNNNGTCISADNTNVSTSSSNSRPFVARNKHHYQNKGHRYNPYQQNYTPMPYPNMNLFPMPGGMPYGQDFMNMAMQGRMNNTMMGLPMMGYNSMSNGSPQNRRIHVNPKFAGTRPPHPQTQPQPQRNDGENNQQHILAHQGLKVNQEPNQKQPEQYRNDQPTMEHKRQNDRKRQYDGQGHHQSDTSLRMDLPSQRRRLDTTSSSSQTPSLQSSTVSTGTYEKPTYRHTTTSSSIGRAIEPQAPARSSSGISIRGAAMAAATASINNANAFYSRDHYASPIRNERTLSPLPQRQTSTIHTKSENTNTPIISRLNLNKNKQHLATSDKSEVNNTILHRLGGRNDSNISNSSETRPVRERNNTPSKNDDDVLIPQYANGKSSKLIISNISSNVTEYDLKALEPKDVKIVSLNSQDNKAILLFVGIDPAVKFRRKYNRTIVGGQHISVNFAKP
ncbi:hypothetical protein BCR42DRAFT_403945 [Absidia repens]|uniref:RRM domain-containing protein n=1 Tax=Absidia repens TaxID=90262 RepID=A0A1X2IVI4_9FUNG|nr:hypothetical protein BCR42DRAFT_403945 [Absidia repens]